jgi:hypothetical protein
VSKHTKWQYVPTDFNLSGIASGGSTTSKLLSNDSRLYGPHAIMKTNRQLEHPEWLISSHETIHTAVPLATSVLRATANVLNERSAMSYL